MKHTLNRKQDRAGAVGRGEGNLSQAHRKIPKVKPPLPSTHTHTHTKMTAPAKKVGSFKVLLQIIFGGGWKQGPTHLI